MVASKQGSTVTLGDFYRGREITIVHGNDALVLNVGSGREESQPLILSVTQGSDFMGDGKQEPCRFALSDRDGGVDSIAYRKQR